MDFNVRPATNNDLAGINDVYNESVLGSTASFDFDAKSLDDRRIWFEAHDPRHPVLVAQRDEEILGWASLSIWSPRPAYAQTVESSIYVKKECQGCGLGKKLYRAILDEAKSLGMHTVIAQITNENEGSIRFHRSFGFQDVGVLKQVGYKFGRSLDVRIMQLFFE